MDKYRVTLTAEERAELEQLVSCGKAAARKLTHARILLLADDSRGDERPDEQIVAALGTSLRTVSRVRQQLVTEGFDAALCRRPQPPRPDKIKIKGDVEQRLIELACSDPPRGPLPLDPATAGRRAGRPGPGRSGQHRDGAAGAEKNDIKPWIVETWCIPPRRRRRLRLAHGGRDPDLPAAVRPGVPGGLLRRGVQATVRRGAAAAAGRAGPSGSGGLRVRAQGRLPPVADVRAVAGLAARPGERSGAPARTTPGASASWWTCITPRPRRSGWCRTT